MKITLYDDDEQVTITNNNKKYKIMKKPPNTHDLNVCEFEWLTHTHIKLTSKHLASPGAPNLFFDMSLPLIFKNQTYIQCFIHF